MTQSLTPLFPASQVGDPSSMKMLISLIRTFGESASLTVSHGVVGDFGNQDGSGSQEGISQEGNQVNFLGISLRCESSSWTDPRIGSPPCLGSHQPAFQGRG